MATIRKVVLNHLMLCSMAKILESFKVSITILQVSIPLLSRVQVEAPRVCISFHVCLKTLFPGCVLS